MFGTSHASCRRGRQEMPLAISGSPFCFRPGTRGCSPDTPEGGRQERKAAESPPHPTTGSMCLLASFSSCIKSRLDPRQGNPSPLGMRRAWGGGGQIYEGVCPH